MDLRELAGRTGLTERHIRYLISQGIVPRPHGGRARADYREEHLAAIDRYLRLSHLGLPASAIAVLVTSHHREGVPIPVADGITLVIDPKLIATGIDPKPVVAEIESLLSALLKDAPHADARRA